MCTPYVFIDDSTDQAYEEEECYEDEDEENFNHYTNQGKPPLTVQATLSKLALSKINPCKLVLPSVVLSKLESN